MIISASRRTDIPAFYSDWFVNRLNKGFLYVKNPFNANQISNIKLSPEIIECIVFWTKNPKKMLNKLKAIDDFGYKYYFQFTVTSYDESIEKNVPRKKEIINTFKKLSDKIGPDKVIWRYDPIFITDKFNIEYHIKWYEYLAKNLNGYTDRCIISFIDMYKKCERNLKEINVEQADISQKRLLAKEFSNTAHSFNLNIETCAEETEFKEEGINPGKCIDDILISKIINSPLSINKDKTQRQECGCVQSVDIGSYNTCRHGCKYCYANYSRKSVENNCSVHDKYSPLITGNLTGKETIIERKIINNFLKQQTLFSD
jgi:DNA repair photolyase